MDTSRLDHLIRRVSTRLSRRTLAGTLGLAALARPFGIEARKKRKKKKKIRRNSFGCVNVGGFCKNSGQCCSGICQGKKGKKKCQAHDTGGCQPGHSIGGCGGQSVTCPDNNEGQCATTTGKSAFCFEFKFQPVPPCTRDADCEGGGFPGAACVLCGDGTTCVVPFV
jgi:hypothetical protein